MEIKVKKIPRFRSVKMCENAHEGDESAIYCSSCGGALAYKTVEIMEYPVNLCDDLLSFDYEDELTEITPPQLFGTGVILARDNTNDDSTWLYLSPHSEPPPQLPFPYGAEITTMRINLKKNHNEIIEMLENHPNVESVHIKTGYVYCPEY